MDNQMMRVAVVGAGLSGLVALKECIEAGMEVDCYEASDHIGGQWAYEETNLDADLSRTWSSIYAGTMLNSCRDTTALSDFPLDPARYGDYFNHRHFLRYLQEYADHFQLLTHIRLNTKVMSCSKSTVDGKWNITVHSGNAQEEHVYDAIFACTGHVSSPLIPVFKNQEQFKGQCFHSHVYRTPGPFEGKKVAIIGLGSSAVDIACEIAPAAEKVHVITRRGAWILPRYVLGKPTEAWDSRASQSWVPTGLGQWLQTKLLNIVDIETPKELAPKHTVFQQSPTVRGDFLEKVACGLITVQRASVDSFTATGLELSTGTSLDVDVVICATGYANYHLPYLPSDVISVPGDDTDAVNLYKLMISPNYNNLFLLGFVETFGPVGPTVEAQARHAVALLQKRLPWPPKEKMDLWIRNYQSHQAKEFIGTARHQMLVHPLPYADDLLEPLGAKPTFGRLFGQFASSPWIALKLFNAVWLGIPASAQYRLFGHGKKDNLARETLVRLNSDNTCLSTKEKEFIQNRF